MLNLLFNQLILRKTSASALVFLLFARRINSEREEF